MLNQVSSFIALASVVVPTIVEGQTRSATGTATSRGAILVDSVRMAIQPQARTIPNVVGMPVMVAVDSLRWTRLRIVQRDSTTTQVANGTVVEQRPRAGTPVAYVRAETLFVASAPKPARRAISWRDIISAVPTSAATSAQDRTRVPNLQQYTPSMVATALKRARLRPGASARDYSDEVPAGHVFRQDPPATKEVATNTSVDVWYSIGPHPVVNTLRVPSVVGLTLAEAADSLRHAKLQPGHVDSLTRRGAGGTVVHQAPQAGQPAHQNDLVDLTIATQPSQAAVPLVTGMSRRVAQRTL